MPIPFILGAAALAAGAFGVKKGLDAKEDMDLANSINEEAQAIANKAQESIENAKDITNGKLVDLGKTKINIMSTSVKDFVNTYSKIHNIRLKDSVGLDELKDFDPNSKEFLEMKEASFSATELATGGIGSIAAGSLAAAGAYGAVGTFAAASTGTAIAGLSGAAATNATLAWLGGGALSAGGFGMAGGMAVLGGIVAGPALAIGGAFLASKAETALYDAQSNRDKAQEFKSQADDIVSTLTFVKNRAVQIGDLLSKLNRYFVPAVSNLGNLVAMQGTDFQKYDKNGQQTVLVAGQLAKTIKTVIDTSIMKEDGSLDDEFKSKIDENTEKLRKLEPAISNLKDIPQLPASSNTSFSSKFNTTYNNSSETSKFDEMLRRARNGSLKHMYDVGHAYEFGEFNQAIDKKEACNWYRMAAQKGFTVAQYRLEQLEKSLKDEVPSQHNVQNLATAEQGENEEVEKIFKKAWNYEHGEGVEKDIDYALFLYGKAAKKGHQMAQARVNFLRANM